MEPSQREIDETSEPTVRFYRLGVTLPLLDQQEAGPVDAQLHGIGSHSIDNQLRYTTAQGQTIHRDITSRTTHQLQPINEVVCHNGSSHGFIQCGAITSKNYSPSYIPNSHSFVRAAMPNCGGDSGASVWRNSSAYGILSGKVGSTLPNCANGQPKREHTIYGAINHVESTLGVSVRIK